MPAPPAHETRQALLAEGTLALKELTPARLLSAFGAKEIAARAGVSTATLYHHFGNLDGFADAVVARLYDIERFPTVDITEVVAAVRRSSLPVEAGLAAHRSEFARLTNDEEMRVRIGLWALGGTAVDETYGSFLRALDERIGAFMAAVFESWGRELRPPFDLESFVAAETALLQGSAIRHSVAPDITDAEKFARTALGLVAVALRTPGDRRTLDDRLTEINYYPLHHETGAKVTDPHDEARARVLDSAAEHFGRDGIDGVTVAQIARAANVSTSTLYNLFDGIDDVAVQLLLWQARDVFARREPPGDLDAVVTEVAEFIGARDNFVAPYAARLATVGAPVGDPIVARIFAVIGGESIESNDAAGAQSEAVVEQAELVALLVVRQMLRHPAAGAAGAVETMNRLSGYSKAD